MLHITVLLFVKPENFKAFENYESKALSLLKKYSGKIIYRIRPTQENFLDDSTEKPYEVHILSFPNESLFKEYINDSERCKLDNSCIEKSILIKETINDH